MSRFLWTQKEDIGPSARFGHAMTYDSVRSRTVLFGGSSLIGGNAAMISTDVQIALFGGTDSSNAVFRETWTFDGTHWTHRQDIGPVPRFSHAMSFDAPRRTIVLFGGRDLTPSLQGDTWEHTETDQ